MPVRDIRLIIGALAAALALADAHAQPPPADPDWPCAQRLVATLSPGSYWAGDVPPPATGWRDEEALASVVTAAVDRDTPDADAAAQVGAYAAHLPVTGRARLFSALVDQTNDQRGLLIARIRQLAHRQNMLAASVSAQSAAIDGAPAARREEMNAQRDLTVRAFQEAQRTMRYACEAPAGMERRLGVFAGVLEGRK